MEREVWSEAEFAAAVDAYLEMRAAAQRGETVNRAEVRRALLHGTLSKRNEASFEYRMRNISAVLELRDEPFLEGYAPARNVGVRGTRIISDLLDKGAVSAAGQRPSIEAPRIFVTGMWGFNPESEGYVGFTRESTRSRLLGVHQPGDLMLIVGQKGEYSLPGDVGRLLGLVELAPEPILEDVRMSADTYARKVELFGADRWKYALPIKRAWRIRQGVKAAAIIGQTYSQKTAQFIGANYAELTTAEVEAVCRLPAKPVAVWGEPNWRPEEQSGGKETTVAVAVSRGPRPSYGKREFTVEDGDNYLYLMSLSGCVDALFPIARPEARGKVIVKVGRSNDPRRRLTEMNSGFPPTAAARWELSQTQKFASGDAAHNAEQALLSHLEERGFALGMEFASLPKKEIFTLFAQFVQESAYLIRAAS